MASSLALQYALVGLAVVVSALFLAQNQWPGAIRRLRVACALPLLREGRAKPLQTLGRLIAPKPTVAKTDCGSCNSCT